MSECDRCEVEQQPMMYCPDCGLTVCTNCFCDCDPAPWPWPAGTVVAHGTTTDGAP